MAEYGEELERMKQEIKKAMHVSDEGYAPLPKDWWDKKNFKDWKDELFNKALFPIDPRIQSLPYGCKYGDYNRKLQDLCFPDRLKPDWELAKRLVRENAPKSLYKYRTVNEYSIQNLRDDTLWLTRAEYFNDPFDCATMEYYADADEYAFDIASVEETSIQLMAELYGQGEIDKDVFERSQERHLTTDHGMDMLRAIHNKKVNIWRRRGWIGCLSEIKDSILMWSYYANSHKGFCIEYNTLEMYERPGIRHNLYPMNYLELNEAWSDSATGMDWLSMYISLRKSAQWKHEKEWRLLFPERVIEGEGNSRGWNLKMPKPTAVYLGALMEPSERDVICDICNKKYIPVLLEQFNYRSMSIRFHSTRELELKKKYDSALMIWLTRIGLALGAEEAMHFLNDMSQDETDTLRDKLKKAVLEVMDPLSMVYESDETKIGTAACDLFEKWIK